MIRPYTNTRSPLRVSHRLPACLPAQVAELKDDISKLELSIMASKAEYDKILHVNTDELARHRRELHADWMHMLHNVAVVQEASAMRALEVCGAVGLGG